MQKLMMTLVVVAVSVCSASDVRAGGDDTCYRIPTTAREPKATSVRGNPRNVVEIPILGGLQHEYRMAAWP